MTNKVDKKAYAKQQAAAQAERKFAEKALRDATTATPIDSPRLVETATPLAANTPVKSRAEKRAARNEELSNARNATSEKLDRLLGILNQEVILLEQIDDHSFFSFNQNSVDAALAGRRLHNELSNLKKIFFTDLTDTTFNTVENFKRDCNALINEAMDSELVKQPFWPEFVYNLLFVVANILTLGVASLVSYVATGSVRFFNVPEKETVGLINNLQETVNIVPSN